MPKELIGQPNEWAWEFYRLIEDFVYKLEDTESLRSKLTTMELSRTCIQTLIDRMTIPAPVDYTCE